jgi:hypothetical protein
MVLATRLSRQPDLQKIYLETGLSSTLSEFTGEKVLGRSRVARIHGALTGIRDFLAIKGTDASRRGVAVEVFLPHTLVPNGAFRERWERVGAHLAAAHRLSAKRSRRSDGLPDATEAVLDPGGAVLHAEREAQVALDALREAARAHRSRPGDPAGVMRSTSGRPSSRRAGRWSITSRQTGRYVVARRNTAEVAAPAGLSPRERPRVPRPATPVDDGRGRSPADRARSPRAPPGSPGCARRCRRRDARGRCRRCRRRAGPVAAHGGRCRGPAAGWARGPARSVADHAARQAGRDGELTRCVEELGFTLHANTCAGAEDERGREALLQYVLRPPIANEHVQEGPEGLVRILLKRPFSDGTTAVDTDQAQIAGGRQASPGPRG